MQRSKIMKLTTSSNYKVAGWRPAPLLIAAIIMSLLAPGWTGWAGRIQIVTITTQTTAIRQRSCDLTKGFTA